MLVLMTLTLKTCLMLVLLVLIDLLFVCLYICIYVIQLIACLLIPLFAFFFCVDKVTLLLIVDPSMHVIVCVLISRCLRMTASECGLKYVTQDSAPYTFLNNYYYYYCCFCCYNYYCCYYQQYHYYLHYHYYYHFIIIRGDGLVQWLERWTGDPKVEGLNPVSSTRKTKLF